MTHIRNFSLASGFVVLVGLAIQGKSDHATPSHDVSPTSQPASPDKFVRATDTSTKPALSSQPASGTQYPLTAHQSRSYWERPGQASCNCPTCRQRSGSEDMPRQFMGQ